ncbi:MAG: homocysteine S-methyltransferase family protein [Phycisphaerales bacterium]|jgi:5-methyltetrahydrofolate--homocysteine methyltransferase
MTSRFLSELRRRVLVLDGAMGTSIYAHDLSVETDYCGCENCTDILVKTRPDLIQSIHETFLAVVADAVETDTFGANELVLSEFGLQAECRALNKKAAEVARAACDRFSTSDKPRFVLGSMGPGTRLITLGNTDWAAMLASYREQARGLLDGGVDAFIIETSQDLLQVKCAINAVLAALGERGKTALDVPIMVSVTIETTGTMLLGTEIAAAAAALAEYPICSLGLNCATGPTEMAPHVQWLGKHWGAMGRSALRADAVQGSGVSARRADLPRVVSVVPNAGLPVLHEGRTEYPLQPAPFVEALAKMVAQNGVGIVGGCCGTTPAHIELLVKTIEQQQREVAKHGGAVGAVSVPRVEQAAAPEAGVTSLYSVQEYRQDNSVLIIGERMNASGSRAFKKLLEVEDWDGIVSLAREQVRHDGAHVLDLNVDYAGRDNARDMAEIVKRVVRQVNVPLMLDSTQPATIEAGLRHAPGKCIINSANFEDGEHKFDQLCLLAKTYGAALVIGSIDEDKENSMARTAERKLAIAERAYERATTVHGMAPEDLVFDPLVLPISTGMESDRRSGLETVEGVRRIMRRFPLCQTTVGLSNCSFGLKPAARVVLNSVFLHELREAGLSSAIVHFSKILPKNKIEQTQWDAALDVIYDRRQPGTDPLQAFIGLFNDATLATTKKEAKTLTLEERLRAHIIDGEKEGVAETLALAREKYKPLEIINDHLLDGMKTVGELFGSGQMQLPFVLQSAEVMKMAVAMLEPYMEKAGAGGKGSIVLATVKGDVHDIGKNLVDIILTNNGYTVHNIGIKQPIADILKAWREHKSDAIGLSGLLVKSVNVMEENLRELNEQGVKVPVLLGGAALTRHYCEGHLRSIYQGECFYGRDAFDGLRTMDFIMSGQTTVLAGEIADRMGKRTKAEEMIQQTRVEKLAKANAESEDAGWKPVPQVGEAAVRVRSDVAVDNLVPKAPFFGTRVVKGIDLDEVYSYINPIALFRGQWQIKKGALSEAAYEALLEDEIQPLFEKLKEQCRRDGILRPEVVYGYFPCNSDGDDLVIWAPEQDSAGTTVRPGTVPPRRELERFHFPRQGDKRRLCISDFFRPVSSGETDVIGLHCVTVGTAASEAAQALFKANRYTDYLYLHGLGVETAEALAEFWHKRMRQELGIAGEDSPAIKGLFTQHYRGSRYSFGYPACPNMSDQEKLFRLLDPARIGCHLTENWQIDPEQSTSAIIVHHPEAKYFNV